jgi:hypothetical protein
MNMQKKGILPIFSILLLSVSVVLPLNGTATTPELKFDHNHTYGEVVVYLQSVIESFPTLAKLHNIGKSYLGKDLLVLEITNQDKGKGLEKPGYWFDGNLHASEVMGTEVCLKTIHTLLTQYGKDPGITSLIDTRTVYIMPKLNPDGSDHYLTKPDGMRSSVRPHDSDRDGLLDEDPPEDLDGDSNITQMKVKDETGPWKTSPDDPRLMVRRKEEEKGEWRVYSEGIDNDKDGQYNEDGVGGLDINRNWPSRWQQEYLQRGAGPYPLSEPETRAVAEFLLSHRNITGVVNHHMAGNFLYRPPTNRNFNPITGEEEEIASEDEAIFQLFGNKYSEIINKQPVRKVLGRGEPPRRGAIWGVRIGWAYDHYGVFSFVPEMGSLAPFCDYDKDKRATETEMLRWNDEELGGQIFVDWKSYDHPQLGKVEIGGFVRKIYNPEFKSYTNLMCYPGPAFEDFLEKHTKWNLYIVSQSPYVRITDVKVEPGEAGYSKITASIHNQGLLPTNVTQQAIKNQTAKTVKVFISLNGAEMIMGKKTTDLGHLPGHTSLDPSPVQSVEWMVKATRTGNPSAVIKVVSEKGGTHAKKISLKAE